MIEVVINYDTEKGVYKVFEPSTNTILVTASLGESFIKLSDFLKDKGMIASDILNSDNIEYHLDSHTFLAIVESNAGLLKRLNNAPSGFMTSSQKFGLSGSNNGNNNSFSQSGKQNKNSSGRWGVKGNFGKKFSSEFSKTTFGISNKKFWNREQ